MLFDGLFHWWQQRPLYHGQLHQARILVAVWQQLIMDAVTGFHLDQGELDQLRELASLFLIRKTTSGAGGLEDRC